MRLPHQFDINGAGTATLPEHTSSTPVCSGVLVSVYTNNPLYYFRLAKCTTGVIRIRKSKNKQRSTKHTHTTKDGVTQECLLSRRRYTVTCLLLLCAFRSS